jgi:hypothetical protein
MKNIKYVSRLWTKKGTQEVIAVLRSAGLEVKKIDSGYIANYNGQLVFKAMIGSKGYLVRHVDNLFVEV